MVSASIFMLHAFLALLLFIRGKRRSTSDALLGVSLVLLIFAVGWTLSTFVMNLVWPERGVGLLIDSWRDTPFKQFLYREVNQDAAALILLTAGEVPMYLRMLRKDELRQKDQRPKNKGQEKET